MKEKLTSALFDFVDPDVIFKSNFRFGYILYAMAMIQSPHLRIRTIFSKPCSHFLVSLKQSKQLLHRQDATGSQTPSKKSHLLFSLATSLFVKVELGDY